MSWAVMGTTPSRPYAAHRRTTKEKVHRRRFRLDRRDFSVLSLRPGDRHRFATNYFHETWHVICHAGAAHFLGRLLWALSYQRRPDTVLVVDQPFLVPNPFDADPSVPFAFVNSDTTHLSHRAAMALGRALPLGGGREQRSPDGTVVMNCQSRPSRIAAARAAESWYDFAEDSVPPWDKLTQTIRVRESNNVIVYCLSARLMRLVSIEIDYLNEFNHADDAVFFNRHWDGEVQTLRNFNGKVSEAKARRRRLFPGRYQQRLTASERFDVWSTPTTSAL